MTNQTPPFLDEVKLTGEKWSTIPSISGYYISNIGRLYTTLLRAGICKGWKDRLGYLKYNAKINGVKKNVFAHRLVALAFIPNPENKPQVNHKDGNKSNSCENNLEWCTNAENLKHAAKNNLMNGLKGERNHFSKIKASDVLKIRNSKEEYELLAKRYGISVSGISKIKQRLTWKHI